MEFCSQLLNIHRQKLCDIKQSQYFVSFQLKISHFIFILSVLLAPNVDDWHRSRPSLKLFPKAKNVHISLMISSMIGWISIKEIAAHLIVTLDEFLHININKVFNSRRFWSSPEPSTVTAPVSLSISVSFFFFPEAKNIQYIMSYIILYDGLCNLCMVVKETSPSLSTEWLH